MENKFKFNPLRYKLYDNVAKYIMGKYFEDRGYKTTCKIDGKDMISTDMIAEKRDEEIKSLELQVRSAKDFNGIKLFRETGDMGYSTVHEDARRSGMKKGKKSGVRTTSTHIIGIDYEFDKFYVVKTKDVLDEPIIEIWVLDPTTEEYVLDEFFDVPNDERYELYDLPREYHPTLHGFRRVPKPSGWDTANYTLIQGSILDSDAKYIVHQCNALDNEFGGLALCMFDKFPHADICSSRPSGMKEPIEGQGLGDIVIKGDGVDSRFIINLIGQMHGGGNFYNPEVIKERADAFKKGLDEIKKIPNLESIAFPWKIGCGIAGGEWFGKGGYEDMINDFAGKVDAEVFVHIIPSDMDDI